MSDVAAFERLKTPGRLVCLIIAGICLASSVAHADDRCSGTLCDLFGKSAPPSVAPAQSQGAQAQPQGATPVTVPTLSMPSTGGIMSFFKSSSNTPSSATEPTGGGASSQQSAGSAFVRTEAAKAEPRCSGTACDLYYGTVGSKSETPTAVATTPATDPAAAAAKRRQMAEQQFKPRCVAPANDPWHCHR